MADRDGGVGEADGGELDADVVRAAVLDQQDLLARARTSLRIALFSMICAAQDAGRTRAWRSQVQPS